MADTRQAQSAWSTYDYIVRACRQRVGVTGGRVRTVAFILCSRLEGGQGGGGGTARPAAEAILSDRWPR